MNVPLVGVRVTVEAAIVRAAGENEPVAVSAVEVTVMVSLPVVTARVPLLTFGV